MISLSFQVGTTGICSSDFVVYIESGIGVPQLVNLYTTEALPLLSGSRLEFTVSTVASGLAYDSKYQMTIEGGYGSERSNASRKFALSKYILTLCSVSIQLSYMCLYNIFLLHVVAANFPTVSFNRATTNVTNTFKIS